MCRFTGTASLARPWSRFLLGRQSRMHKNKMALSRAVTVTPFSWARAVSSRADREMAE